MTGEYRRDNYDCSGKLMYTEIIIFNGWYCRFAGIDWGDEPEYWEDPDEYTVWDTGFHVRWSNCNIEPETNRPYIDFQLFLQNGWNNPALGPWKRVYCYGKHELEWYEPEEEGGCEWNEETQEWDGDGRSIVTSLPRAFIFVKHKEEE